MTLEVFFSEDAARDLEDIYTYIAEQDGTARAEQILTALENRCHRLSDFPEQGNVPKELRSLGISEYREVHVRPYRVIYRLEDRRLIVHCVLDGRRDMQSLLQERLMR